MDYSPSPLDTTSRKRAFSGSISPPHERPELETSRNPATSPPRMVKRRKLLTAPKEPRRDDLFEGMEVEEQFVDDALAVEIGEEKRVADSGRLQSLSTSPSPIPALEITDAPHPEPQLSPEEARTQMYNVRGRTHPFSPLGPSSDIVEETLHEVPDRFIATGSTALQHAPSTDQMMVEGSFSVNTVFASDEWFHDPTVSTRGTMIATAGWVHDATVPGTITSPLAYTTPIRNRESIMISADLVGQELPRRIRRNGSAVVLPGQHAHSTLQDSLSPTRRLGSGSRSTTDTLSRSPSVPSPSTLMLSRSPSASSPFAFMLPPVADGSPTSFRTSVTERRRLNPLTIRRSRHNEDAENQPIELDSDRTVVSADVSGSSTRFRTVQLEHDVESWQRSLSGPGYVDSDGGYRSIVPPGHTVSARQASRRQNVAPGNGADARRADLNFASSARAGSQPIRAELPRIQGTSSRTEHNSTGEARDSMEPLGTIDYNHFTSFHGRNLGRTTSFGSSVMTAPGTDEHDRDVIMESSSPRAYSNAGSDLVEDMDSCQLEGDLRERVAQEDTWGICQQKEEGIESSEQTATR